MSMSRWMKAAVLAAATWSLALDGSAQATPLVEQALGGTFTPLASQQLEVEGKGVITAISGTCPDVVITIQGIPITVNASTVFPIGQTCGQLAVNQQVEVRGTLTVNGTTLSVVAKSIEVEDGNEGEGEGRVTAVTGTCPDLTITVDGITVKLDALTRYVPAGASCSLIKVGTKLKVKAVPAPGGGFRARTVEIKGQRNFGEGESRITAVTGACPDVTIAFGRTEVLVNASTVFVGGTCSDLAVGSVVQVKGFRDDGATQNVATLVKFKSRHVEGRSVVTKVTGTCPTLTIVVGGVVSVVTDANTVFKGGSCLMVRTGVKVHVKGDMKTEDGSVIAEEIEIEGHPGGNPGGRIEGTIQTLGGTCPALTLTVKGIQVKTTSTTKFDRVACGTLAVGTKIEVEGDVQNGVLTATKVELED